MKTTVYLDAAEYRRLKAMAAAEGRSAAELIRTAVSEYVGAHGPAGRPSSIGLGNSADGTLSERAESLLEGFGDDS